MLCVHWISNSRESSFHSMELKTALVKEHEIINRLYVWEKEGCGTREKLGQDKTHSMSI